jgi:drug/metabolite transporter (DMT)-like permease
MIRALPAAALVLLAAAPAWADHGIGGGGRSAPMSPLLTALLWAGAAFLAGIALVAIVTVLARRRSSEPPEV